MAAVYPITSTGSSSVARPAKSRNYLGIFNQSATTIYIAFDTPATAAATAGQLTLLTGASVTFGPGDAQTVPSGAINVIGAGALTIVEG